VSAPAVTTRQAVISWMILLGLLLLLASILLLPWWNWLNHYDAAKAQGLERLQGYNRLIRERAALEARLSDPMAQARMKADYLSPTTSALAAVELQQKIKAIVANGNGKLLSTQILPVQKRDPATRITVKVRIQGDASALLVVLHTLESDKPPLFVENLSVRKYQRRGARLGGQLDIRFDLSGYMRQVEG